MKQIFKILNILVLFILTLVFVLVNFIKKTSDQYENIVKEAFQNSSDDISSVFFDLSANYMKLSDSEKPKGLNLPEDELILDIGGAFGEFDASRIPWDSENKELLPSQALWGVVSSQASFALFSKIIEANQFADVEKLPFDEEKKAVLYQSPLLTSDATSEDEKKRYEIAEQVVNLAAPMIMGVYLESLMDTSIMKSGTVKPTPLPVLPSQTSAVKNARLAKVETKTAKAAKFLKLDKLAYAVTKITRIAKASGQKISTFIAKKLYSILGKTATKLIMKVIISSVVLSVSLAAIPVVGPFLDIIYNIIVMPLVLALSMSGVVDNALSKSADPEGCCPPNSIPLDTLIPESANLIVSNIPIIGDILGFFYPYVCSENGTGRLLYKTTLILPKYINYSWLTSYYLEWPEYNCRIDGRSVIYGKTLQTNSYDWNNNGIGTYTNLDEVVENPDSKAQIIRKYVNGRRDDSEKQYIAGMPGFKFFYADFTEPQMLVDMAQFYYKWALLNPYPNDDGTVSVEYISKINYVSASSLYSCDVMCEMISVSYDPFTGKKYSETISYDRDRRFYYTVNSSSNAPRFWENSANIEWKQHDDACDLAINDLNNFLHQDTFNNTSLDASILTTAYRQMNDASNRISFFSNIIYSNALNGYASQSDNNTLSQFIEAYNNARSSLLELPRTYLTNYNSNFDSNILNYCSTIVGYSNQLYEMHKNLSDSRIGTYRNNQYTIVGCTHVDNTASAAANPDINSLESDTRYFTNFNVLPYIKRCENVSINLNQCIDASNIELVIYNYYLQNPNKRIKSIKNIKAKGRNACEFIWDEVDYNTTTLAETNYRSNVNTTVLYQQDLSSCTFCLPPPTVVSGSSNYLFGVQTGGTGTLNLPSASIKNYKNPISNINDPNYSNNVALQYQQARFNYPVMPTQAQKANLPVDRQNLPISFTLSNVDYVPRYDTTTFVQLPELVRPKKPIRVRYPNNDQSNLGNYTSNYCSDEATLNKFILSYNGNSNNINKIAKIIRTFTSSSNTCDMEVDMYIKDTKQLQRKTMTMNMREGFQSHIFTYDSVNTQQSGLNITDTTDPLSNPYQLGYGYGQPFINDFNRNITSNSTYFNDNLVKNFTNSTKSIRDGSQRMLIGIIGTQTLGGSNCSTKCSDDTIVQRVIEQYNKDNVPKNRFGAYGESVIQVVNSATASSNTCHVIMETKNDYYADYYDANPKSSSNYVTNNRLVLKEVQMTDAGNCTFYPTPNQIYSDISASDLAFASSSNFNTYKKPFRSDCIPVNCADSNLYNAALNDYKAATGNMVLDVSKSMNIGTNICDYLINSELYIPRYNTHLETDNYVLRVNYSNTLYNPGVSSNCSLDNTYGYRNGNFKLQVTDADLANPIYGVNMNNYKIIDSNSSDVSPLMSYDPANNSDPMNVKVININY